MVHTGVRLARRFTLLSTEPVDIPGINRFVAHDDRLHRQVRVDIITSLAPSSVRQAAGAAARVRDPRLLRVLASGRERIADEPCTYVVTDPIDGTVLSDLFATHLVSPSIAAAIVGDAARALEAALAEHVHHGYLRPSAIFVTAGGRVTITGVGMDGELALQAGVGRGNDEAADAVALGKIYLTAVTGMDADAATERDLPRELGTRAKKLCARVINGTGPRLLSEVSSALVPIDTRLLSDFPAVVHGLALRPVAAQDQAKGVRDSQWNAPVTQIDPLTAPLEQVTGDNEPRDEHPDASDLHDLYEFDEMVEVQNLDDSPSTEEAILQRLHQRWPQSQAITRWLARTDARANRAGPIRAELLLIPLLVIIVIVGAVMAFSLLRGPPDSDRDPPPPVRYPEFTLSPSPTPSPTPSVWASPSASPTATPQD